MTTIIRLLINLFIFLVVVGTMFFVYQAYKDRVVNYLFGDETVGLFVGSTAVNVSIADTPEERRFGLSGVPFLPEQAGKLFIFDQEGEYGIWMKDMAFPLDVIWINNLQEIVHIERNMRPDSFPVVYTSPTKARFVLEVNAFFVDTFNIHTGDRVSIPAHKLPPDLR